MVYRQLQLDTEGAVLLAKSMLALTLNYDDTEMPEAVRSFHTELWWMAIPSFPFDEPAQHHVARQYLEEVGMYAPDEPQVRAAITDVLHPWTLQRQFALAEIREIPGESKRPDGVRVLYPDGPIGFMKGMADERVTVLIQAEDESDDRPRVIELLPASALLLIAVQEGLTYVGMAEYQFTDIDPDALAALRTRLHALRQEVVDEIDVTAGYRQLTELFDPRGWPGVSASAPLGQLNAIATIAMDKWMARRGTTPLDHRVDLGRVIAATGVEPVSSAGEHALQFESGELVFRLEGDLAVGRGKVISAEGRLVSMPIAFSAPTLEWVAWALAALDALAGSVARALGEYVIGALKAPWGLP